MILPQGTPKVRRKIVANRQKTTRRKPDPEQLRPNGQGKGFNCAVGKPVGKVKLYAGIKPCQTHQEATRRAPEGVDVAKRFLESVV
ncbi:MAG TPA: hypothetical protein VJ440_13695 [Candidatus Brocadiaceae bacterium]|nr:hypothetical protein [Candidatus Brocadiaceae bacterium]